MKTYQACGRPNACCPELGHDEENDVYHLFDKEKGWTTPELFLHDIEIIHKITGKAIKEAKKKE